LPVGAFGASAELLECISPLGDVYQAGTLSGNPVAMSAGIAQLTQCLGEGFYEDQERRTKLLVDKVNAHAKSKGYNFEMFTIGSIFWLAFSDAEAIRSASEIRAESMNDFKALYANLLNKGIYLGPSGYEVGFVSQAHTDEVLIGVADLFCTALDEVLA